jgi:hypothetical protein
MIDGTVHVRKPFQPKFRTAEEFHCVEARPDKPGDIWTFFIHGRRRRDWGFLTKDGWVQHEEYNKQLGLM